MNKNRACSNSCLDVTLKAGLGRETIVNDTHWPVFYVIDMKKGAPINNAEVTVKTPWNNITVQAAPLYTKEGVRWNGEYQSIFVAPRKPGEYKFYVRVSVKGYPTIEKEFNIKAITPPEPKPSSVSPPI